MCSQKYYPFKMLAKYNAIEVHGVLCKHTAVEPLAISLLGTDATPIVSNKDPISKLLINKAHQREIHNKTYSFYSLNNFGQTNGREI